MNFNIGHQAPKSLHLVIRPHQWFARNCLSLLWQSLLQGFFFKMPGVLWGCRSNEKSCAVAPFLETLMSLGSLIHTTYYHLLENVVEKCHKSTNPSWRQGGRFNFSSGGSNICISLWMRRPLTGLLFGRLLSRRDSPKPEALPPRRMAQAGSIRLPPGSPMASNLFQQRAAARPRALATHS